MSEGKKSDSKLLFLEMLSSDSGWKVSCQLWFFEVEMVAVHVSTIPVSKLDLLLCLVLGKRQA